MHSRLKGLPNLGNINFGSLGLVLLTVGGDGVLTTEGGSLVVGTLVASRLPLQQQSQILQFQHQLNPTRND